jgi:hypothetical protein
MGRDAHVWIAELTRIGRAAGLPVDDLLAEVAALSSAEARYGGNWGSTRKFLMQRVGRR